MYVPTCPPGVLVIWLGFDVGFEFFLLVSHIHPSVPHYLLLGGKSRKHFSDGNTSAMKNILEGLAKKSGVVM